ncbi:MAG: iron-containing alcohol dehydrogenase [Clostridia bacterium]|nr:iron-containing alcohol dehydrogenase [Clostridia bacterium]
MQNFDFYNPVKVLYGPGRTNEIGIEAAKIGKIALVVTYSDAPYLDPLIQRVKGLLEAAGVQAILHKAATANPQLCQAKSGVQLCRDHQVDLVIGVGGGSAMDLSKVIAAGALFPHDDIRKMIKFSHSHSLDIPLEKALPTLMLPTLPATGSEMNPTAVITDEVTHEKSYVWAPQCLFPQTAIIDPELLTTLPRYQMACGGVDIVSHILESYVNGSGEGMDVIDGMQEGVMKAVLANIVKAIECPEDTATRGMLQWASDIAINGWVTSGTYSFTPMHQMGHVLSARYNATHGATLSAMMIAWFRYFDQKQGNERYVKAARQIFGCTTPLEASQWMEKKFSDYGIQISIKQFGVKKEEIRSLAEDVQRISFSADNVLPCLPPLNVDDIEEIFALSYELGQ